MLDHLWLENCFCSWIVSAHGDQKSPKCAGQQATPVGGTSEPTTGFFRENLIVFLFVVLRDCEKSQRQNVFNFIYQN
jgi:hypothetical protein